jgi:hypothetical protein
MSYYVNYVWFNGVILRRCKLVCLISREQKLIYSPSLMGLFNETVSIAIIIFINDNLSLFTYTKRTEYFT